MSEQGTRVDRAAECASALMPVLLERMQAESRRLQTLNDLVAAGRAGSGESEQDLRRVSLELEELGWLMGVVARGLGVDLLGERRYREGLAPLLHLVRDALGERRRSLAAVGQRLPQVGTEADAGPYAAWVVAVLLWLAAGESEPGDEPLRWSLLPLDDGAGDGHVLRVERRASREVEASGRALAAPLAGARFEARPRAWTLELPGAYLVTPA